MIPINSATNPELFHRRRFLRSASLGAATLFTVPGAFAEALQRTPSDAEGPFYPDELPLDTDNDLLIVNDKITPAAGAVSYLGGVVMNVKGQPLRNALVEIWQVDNKGIYLHSKAPCAAVPLFHSPVWPYPWGVHVADFAAIRAF